MPATKNAKGTKPEPEQELIERGSPRVPIFIKSGWSFLVEVGKVVAISLVIITIVKNFLFQPFYVKGASMEPTFFDKEYLIINEIEYRFRPPARGDIVVLRYPKDPSQFFIKRVIGLPGERIDIHDDTVTIANDQHPEGMILDESLYLDPTMLTNGSGTYPLGPDQYFVLGDNRIASLDSRSTSLGPIDRSSIIGRAWFRLWPVPRFTIFETPSYGSNAP